MENSLERTELLESLINEIKLIDKLIEISNRLTSNLNEEKIKVYNKINEFTKL